MPRPKSINANKTPISIYISPELREWMQIKADKDSRPLSRMAVLILEQVKEHEQLIGN